METDSIENILRETMLLIAHTICFFVNILKRKMGTRQNSKFSERLKTRWPCLFKKSPFFVCVKWPFFFGSDLKVDTWSTFHQANEILYESKAADLGEENFTDVTPVILYVVHGAQMTIIYSIF